MSVLLSDVKHAVRSLARAPYVTIVAVLSIGIGVGGATAVFSWLDGMVLHPFPAATDQERLVGVEVGPPNGGMGAWSYQSYKEMRDGLRTINGLAAYRLLRVAVREPSENSSVPLIVTAVSGNYFKTFGASPVLGRAIEDNDVNASTPVAMLSYQYWQDRYFGDRSVLGKTILFNGDAYRVVGVAPPKFEGGYLGVASQFYAPLTVQPRISGVNTLLDRKMRTWLVFGRLAPGATFEQAQKDADAVARRIGATYGDTPAPGAQTTYLRVQFLGRTLSPLLMTMFAVTILLVVLASANVAALLLVRAGARQSEIAVRRAMGASTFDLVRGSLIESAVIAILGSAAGVGFAWLARSGLYAFLPSGSLPYAVDIPLSARVLGVALCAAAAVTVGCGVAPALAAMRVAPQRALRAGSRALAGTGTRVRSAIVAGQLACCVVFLVFAGMFLRGLEKARAVDIGFSDPEHVLLVGTNFRLARLDDSAGELAIDQLLQRLRGIPGVTSASMATMIPLGFGGVDVVDAKVEGYVPAPNESMGVNRSMVGPDYARTMNIRIVAGRDIVDDDRAGSLPVAVVNETFAKRYLAGRQAVGQRFDIGRGWETVVGVLHDGKYGQLEEAPQAVIYVPIRQWYNPAPTIHVRTNGDPLRLTEAVRKNILSVNGDLPSVQPRTLAEHIGAATFTQRTGVKVLGIFAILAIGLSVIGLYGALAFSVVLRQRELAIRIAVGAGDQAVTWTVARQGLVICAWGLGSGVALAIGGGQLLRSQIDNLAAADPLLYMGAAFVLLMAALLSSWIPARRAMRLDPALLLRGD
jgi:putative ABC transport system permease protein